MVTVHVQVSSDRQLKPVAAVHRESGQHMVKKSDSGIYCDFSAIQAEQKPDLGFLCLARNLSRAHL